MSDIMLHGVLRMPPELWTNDPIDIAQRHGRYIEASERIYELEQKLAEARELRDGDNRLIEALAEDVGIKISCNPKLLGVVWEQFHDGVFELKRERDELREELAEAKRESLRCLLNPQCAVEEGAI